MKLFRSWKMAAAALAVAGAALFGLQAEPVVASDHDDGETQIKARNLNLTDLYVFREDWQTDQAADNGNLIFIMNTNPRSLPRQQYFFNTEAKYNFHVSRVSNVDDAVNGREDIRFEFIFGAPDSTTSQQPISMTVVRLQDGVATSSETATGGLTTPAPPLLGDPNPSPITNTFSVGGTDINVFAGLREDPFFFDVEAFFRVRAALAMAGPAATFSGTDQANDFAQGYNVNSIVVRVPISFLQQNSETSFDVWETVSVPSDLAARQ